MLIFFGLLEVVYSSTTVVLRSLYIWGDRREHALLPWYFFCTSDVSAAAVLALLVFSLQVRINRLRLALIQIKNPELSRLSSVQDKHVKLMQVGASVHTVIVCVVCVFFIRGTSTIIRLSVQQTNRGARVPHWLLTLVAFSNVASHITYYR